MILFQDDRTDFRKIYLKQLSEYRSPSAFPGEKDLAKIALNYGKRRRKYQLAQNETEADGIFPTLEEHLGKKEEDIIRDGNLRELMRLFYSYKDFRGFAGGDKMTFPQEAEDALNNAIKTSEDEEMAKQYTKEFYSLKEYGQSLALYFRMFQGSFGRLAVLIEKWEGYDREAQHLTNGYQGAFSAETGAYGDEAKAKEMLAPYVQNILQTTKFEGATLRFNDGIFWIDVDVDGGLYSQIERASHFATADLADLKAHIEVAQYFIKKSKFKYTPLNIKVNSANVINETYTRWVVKDLLYFRSNLNERLLRGEEVLPEERKRAVIPDYNEVEATPWAINNCRMGLRNLLKS